MDFKLAIINMFIIGWIKYEYVQVCQGNQLVHTFLRKGVWIEEKIDTRLKIESGGHFSEHWIFPKFIFIALLYLIPKGKAKGHVIIIQGRNKNDSFLNIQSIYYLCPKSNILLFGAKYPVQTSCYLGKTCNNATLGQTSYCLFL